MMASRTYAASGVLLATAFGIFTAYSAFQPELKKQADERQGIFHDQHEQEKQDHVLSDAIISDLRQAEKQYIGPTKKGALWGIREAIWGKPEDVQQARGAMDAAQQSPAVAKSKAEDVKKG
jgi:predicted outer membrane lipoprotein